MNLGVGHALVAARAKAGRREQLDEVGAFALRPIDERAQRVGIAGSILNLAHRRQDARSDERSAADRVTNDGVGRGAELCTVVNPPSSVARAFSAV
jgi:hypothetical protein